METFREKGTQLWSGHIRTRLDHLYLKKIGQVPDKIGQDNLVGETFSSLAYKVALQNETNGPTTPNRDDILIARIEKFLDEKPFLIDKIREHAGLEQGKNYRESSILLAYFAAYEAPFQSKSLLPYNQILNGVYVDLGFSPERAGR